MKMALGSFLIDRLVSLGVSRICGVPGDYNLEFLELLAAYEINRVLQVCRREKRPAHLQLPTSASPRPMFPIAHRSLRLLQATLPRWMQPQPASPRDFGVD